MGSKKRDYSAKSGRVGVHASGLVLRVVDEETTRKLSEIAPNNIE